LGSWESMKLGEDSQIYELVCLFEELSYVNYLISHSFNLECMTFETECTFVYNNRRSKTNSDQHSLPLLHNWPQPPFPGS
jgi:hypothetical protein